MKKILLVCFVFQFCAGVAQEPATTSGQIYLGLKKLNVLGSVLYIAAHPDDENTRLITYFSKDKLYRTGYLSVTRGDGGQNLIGDEQGIELGLIRTQELLSARKIDGGEQFFTRAYDFGYSKTPEETFEKWGKEQILSDVVWVIRNFRPDVIITRFPSTGEGGHGHHTASAILANEAFVAAADPKRFPEQLKHVEPWQAKRILWNTFNFGGNNTTGSDQFKIDVGGFNAVLGKSYGEIAAESRSQHKSQGFGVPRSRGEALEFFRTTAGVPPSNELFDNIDTDWSRVPGGIEVKKQIDNAITGFDFLHPENSVPALVNIYRSISNLSPGYWKEQKLNEVKELITSASGIWLEAFANQPYAVQTDSLKFNAVVNDRAGVGATLKQVSIAGKDTSLRAALPKNKNFTLSQTIFVSPSTPLTQPYWLKEKMKEGHYVVEDQLKIGKPDAEPAYLVSFTINISGQDFQFSEPLKYKYNDPVKGEVYQPLFVVPAATVSTSPDVVLFTDKTKTQKKEVVLQLNAHTQIAGKANAHLKSTQYDLDRPDNLSLSKNASTTYSFLLDTIKGQKQTDYIYGSVGLNKYENDFRLAIRAINYDHIPSIRYFYNDAVKLVKMDLKTAGKNIGYIPGAGDKVPDALEQMGYIVTILTEKELAKNNLQQFDAIITGVRAYNTNEWMNTYYEKLMKYVQDGGNLIVQYNTSSQIGPVRAKMGPYNFDITRNRITDENADVQFLEPQHRVLNFPNKIDRRDFEDWIQERSIYHAGSYDANFKAIFGMKDPGEKSDNGSLIIAPYGKGFFTYTGLVFFRELPAVVPGAYRLLANLIALNQLKSM